MSRTDSDSVGQPEATDGSERRQLFRLKMDPPLPCIFVGKGREIRTNAAILNLSGSGCQLRSAADHPSHGTQLYLSFKFDGQSYGINCSIAWKRRGLQTYFYGVEFRDMPVAAQEQLVRSLFKAQRDRLRP